MSASRFAAACRTVVFSLFLMSAITASALASETSDTSNGGMESLSLAGLFESAESYASLVKLPFLRVPSSVTIITAEDIKVTPAKSLYDLIEIYVPGALWMNHYDSPKLGIRGIIMDRNYKILLLVNGRNMNMKTKNGATSELVNWDLDDIYKVEVIRGPGSVTYGPGAVAGVINIVTKDAVKDPGNTVSGGFNWPYNSKNIKGKIGVVEDKMSFYGYGSLVKTKGLDKTHSFFTDWWWGSAGWRGETDSRGPQFSPGDPTFDPSRPTFNYLCDPNGEPQVKLYSELKILDNYKISARYVTGGSYQVPSRDWKDAPINDVRVESVTLDSNGTPVVTYAYLQNPVLKNDIWNSDKHFTTTVEGEQTIENINISGMLSWSSESFLRQKGAFTMGEDDTMVSSQTFQTYSNAENPIYFLQNSSENELFGRLLGSTDLFDGMLQVAGGLEVSRTWIRAAWGYEDKYIRLGDANNMVYGDDSPYLYQPGHRVTFLIEPGTQINVGKGWAMNTISGLGEINFAPSKYIT
jgi:outer membrane receptor protein involved in Fe transport